MMTTNQAPAGGTNRVSQLMNMGQSAWRLAQDPSVPLMLKFIPILAVIYVISPIDLVPDVLPIVGQIDDVAILLLALGLFVRLAQDHAGTPAASTSGGPGSAAEDFTTTYRVRED
jgi:uncharacterized membrane protein YkvA (DUF1232 family)